MKLYQVDAFTSKAFSGNPACVCITDEPLDTGLMQDIAAEMNLSETAFITERDGGEGFDLRWFTPAREVDLCGHATLASAHILYQIKHVGADIEIRFHTRSGILRCRKQDSAILMDFPAAEVKPSELPEGAVEALGISPVYTGFSSFYFMIELESVEALQNCKPDFARLKELSEHCFIITAPSDDETFDFYSRMFAPAYGIHEDPVTGSAHCLLGPYWGEKLGKLKLRAFQASARGGVLGVNLKGDRVELAGQAITVMVGELFPELEEETEETEDENQS